MAFAGFHGLPRKLQLNVIECNIMTDRDSSMRQTEWYLRVQHFKIFVINSTYTYETKKQLMELAHFLGVWFEDADGGMNPTFQDEIVFEPSVRELTVVVARNEAFASEDVVGTATIQLDAVLQEDYGEFHLALKKTSCGSRVGELKLTLKLKNANTNTFEGPRVPLLVAPGAGGYNIQAAPPSYNYPYNLAAYPPFSYPPANPIPYYYLPPPSPYPQPQQQPLLSPQPQQQPLLSPQFILSHGIGGVVNEFVEQLFQNLFSNLSHYYGGSGFNN